MSTTLNISMRPTQFGEIIGLEKQVAEIKAAIDSDRIPRAWILSGPFGCGKTTLAKIIGKYVQGWDFQGDPMIQEINAASVRGIDAMRRIAESAATYPMAPAKYNVINLDEAHQLSKDAKQLLLKEFESPSAPTIWIISTTNPEKLGAGILAGRCMHIVVAGMGPAERRELVTRAAKHVNYVGDIVPFLTALTDAKITSPRVILMAFELFLTNGDAVRATQAAKFTEEILPEYFEVAVGIIWGKWSESFSTFIKDKDNKPKKFPGVGAMLKEIEESLAKKPKEDTDAPVAAPAAPSPEAESGAVVEETQEGKPEAARAILAVLAAMLKNQVYKGNAKAAEVLRLMPGALPTDPALTALLWPCMVGFCFKANQYLGAK